MDVHKLRRYLLNKPESMKDYPFGPDVEVYKVLGKVFALLWHEKNDNNGAVSFINLKCDPEEAIELRYVFEQVKPGYHMNKKHWNTVQLDGELPDSEVERMIDNSYRLVIKGLPKMQRKGLELKLISSG